ncbi:MAG: hypothetical protein ACM3TR_14985 [Caulobacteraceae bacterium]
MNFHEDKKGNQGSHNHSPLKHLLHMGLCCGLPILIILALPLIARLSPGAGAVLGWIAPFLCPLMMLAMLPMMFRGNKKENCCSDKNENNENNKPLELNKSVE